MTIPLAWLQLLRERRRLLVAIAGISFADILMFMQLGFQDALFDSATLVPKKFQADLVVVSPQTEATHLTTLFSRRRLYQARGVVGVDSVSVLYGDYAKWKNPQTKRTRNIMVLGINPSQVTLNLPEVNRNLNKLKQIDKVLFDTASRPEFGPIQTQFEQGKEIRTELNGYKVIVGGLFTLGTTFASDGYVIVSSSNFLRLFPERNPDLIDIGLIKLKPGVDAGVVVRQLNAKLPTDVKVLTREDFVKFEKTYWATSTPIGFIFLIGILMGFVVGAVIVYQILYTDVSNHLPAYATLKAMGYKHRYLLGVIFQEAFILAVLGYFPALACSLVLYNLTKTATQLPIMMSLLRALWVLLLTIVMCSLAGAFAVRRLQDADPADIF